MWCSGEGWRGPGHHSPPWMIFHPSPWLTQGIINAESFQVFILCVLMLDDMVNECKVDWKTKPGDPGPL